MRDSYVVCVCMFRWMLDSAQPIATRICHSLLPYTGKLSYTESSIRMKGVGGGRS